MIAIVDYGLGNVTAFANVFDRIKQPYVLAKAASDLSTATRIVLPGVGSFDYAMKLLEDSGMAPELNRKVLEEKTPVLGVCVGMQMMAQASEEGSRPGLGWFDGEVKKFLETPDESVRIPHMGWNTARTAREHPLVAGLDNDSRFYFLHSYYFECHREADVLATTEYDGKFACAVAHENILGVQFHPEKSHRWGSRLLENFARL
jgi:imidazole glycerol-phosphate synthase subunit HisH